MKQKKYKKRNSWLRGFQILIYLNTNKQTEKKVHWLSITRIFVLTWSALMLLYHIFWIGMTSKNGIIQHIIGMVIEYLISGIYENSIVRMDKFINKKTLDSKYQKAKRITLKYLAFGAIFNVTYSLVYIVRMGVLYAINLGMLDWTQTKTAVINGILFGTIIGPILGMIIVYFREKKLKIKIIKKSEAPVGRSFFLFQQ